VRHQKRGRKLGRTASHKKAMLNNMATSLFDHGRVRTTLAKGKELRSMAERLITFAKRGDLHARRRVLRRIRNKVVVAKLFDEIAPTFSERSGGYTRVLKLGPRRGDATEICIVEMVGEELRRDYAEKSESRGKRQAAADVVEEVDGDEEDEGSEDASEEAASEDPDGDEADAESEGEKTES
jgi:large subunit ribosomal protein L17